MRLRRDSVTSSRWSAGRTRVVGHGPLVGLLVLVAWLVFCAPAAHAAADLSGTLRHQWEITGEDAVGVQPDEGRVRADAWYCVSEGDGTPDSAVFQPIAMRLSTVAPTPPAVHDA